MQEQFRGGGRKTSRQTASRIRLCVFCLSQKTVARFRGKYFTHAREPMRSFGKKSHLCRRDGAFFGKKSHPCGRACVFFWVENALMRNGWRALSGKIFHPCERADTIFWEEISRLQVSLRVLSRKKSHPCRRVARAFGNDMALFERGRQDVPSFSRLLQ